MTMNGLKGRTILLTRSAESNKTLERQLRERGASVVSLPTIEFADPLSWEEADRVLQHLDEYDGFLFTSRTAVERFLRRAELINGGFREILQRARLYAIGEKTEEALTREGFSNVVTPEVSTAEEMADSLAAQELSGAKFLFPKSEIARDVLPNALRQHEATVDEIVVYRNVPPLQKDLDEVRTRLAEGTISVTTFFSPSAVRNFVQMLGATALASAANAAIGPTTAGAIKGFGASVSVLPEHPTTESLLDALERYCSTLTTDNHE